MTSFAAIVPFADFIVDPELKKMLTNLQNLSYQSFIL